MKKPFGGVTYANVTATLALIIALGGVAWAAETAKKNSVVSKSIKNEEVKSKDLDEQAVDDDAVRDLSQDAEDMPLLNGWAYDDTLVISKSVDGVVRLDGNIDGDASTNDDAFALPAGFRPADDAIFIAGCQGGETAILSVNSDNGNVNVSASPTCDNKITLTGISFTGDLTPVRRSSVSRAAGIDTFVDLTLIEHLGLTDEAHFVGEIDSDKRKCLLDRKVVVYRKRGGADEKIGTTEANEDKPNKFGWSLLTPGQAKAGKYYGKAPAAGNCKPDKCDPYTYETV